MRLERTFVWRIWERPLEAEFIGRIITLAGKAFISSFPLLIAVVAFVPECIRSSIISTIIHRLGIVGQSQKEIKATFASAGSIRRATGALRLIFTFSFASSFMCAPGSLQSDLETAARSRAAVLLSGVRLAGRLCGLSGYLRPPTHERRGAGLEARRLGGRLEALWHCDQPL